MAGLPKTRFRAVSRWQWCAVVALLIPSALMIGTFGDARLSVLFFSLATILLLAASWGISSRWSHPWSAPGLILVTAGIQAGLGFAADAPISMSALVPCLGAVGSLVALRPFSKRSLPTASLLEQSPVLSQAPIQAKPKTAPVATSIDSALEARLLARLAPEDADAPIDDEETEDESNGLMSFAEAEREVTLRVARGFAPDGTEWIEGSLKVSFAAGQRLATLHLPLWPALTSLPEVQCELLAGRSLQIKVAGRYRWGVRLEVTRQSGATQPEEAEIAFFMRESHLRSEAA